jgi:hypothetical protein
MASVSITLDGLSDTTGLTEPASNPKGQILALEDVLHGVAIGALKCATVKVNASATAAVAAASEVTATTSGNLGTVINGTTVTTTFTTDQAGTAAKAITDINANTTVNKFVRASAGSTTAKFYLTAVLPGALGNCCTVTVTGTGAAATGAGKLIGGTGVDSAPVTYLP